MNVYFHFSEIIMHLDDQIINQRKQLNSPKTHISPYPHVKASRLTCQSSLTNSLQYSYRQINFTPEPVVDKQHIIRIQNIAIVRKAWCFREHIRGDTCYVKCFLIIRFAIPVICIYLLQDNQHIRYNIIRNSVILHCRGISFLLT